MKISMNWLSILLLLLAGCTAVERSRAVVDDGVIRNSALGFFGFSFEIPEDFELYDPVAESVAERTELQEMAIRIYELNEDYHPSGNETFYESFLMLSSQTAFLLVTVTHDQTASAGGDWLDGESTMQRALFPMYNAKSRERFMMGDSGQVALRLSGTAYESDGWYYAAPKEGRQPFCYKACRIQGVNRDSYILMGFSLPEYEHVLSLQIQEMEDGFRF